MTCICMHASLTLHRVYLHNEKFPVTLTFSTWIFENYIFIISLKSASIEEAPVAEVLCSISIARSCYR